MADNTIRVRYFAVAAEVAGCAEENVQVSDKATLRELACALTARHGPTMAQILSVAAFLRGDELTRDLDREAGTHVDVLPPFAGG